MNFNQKLFHIFTTFTQKSKVPIYFKFMEYVDKIYAKMILHSKIYSKIAEKFDLKMTTFFLMNILKEKH